MPLITLLLAVAVIALVVWWVPKAQAKRARAHLSSTELPLAEDQFRRTLAEIIGGILILGSFLLTWLQLMSSQENFVKSQENLNVSLQQQMRGLATERLTRAIEQLNDPERAAARLAGVYALGRIDEELRELGIAGDQGFVAEVLAAHILERDSERSATREVNAAMSIIADRPLMTAIYETLLEDPVAPRPEQLDLRGAELVGLHLRGERTDRPNLSALDLEKSILNGACVLFVDFLFTDLDLAELRGANLQGADFSGASLQEAVLTQALVAGADFRRAVVTGMDVRHTDLTQAQLATEQLCSLCFDKTTILPREYEEWRDTEGGGCGEAVEQGANCATAEWTPWLQSGCVES